MKQSHQGIRVMDQATKRLSEGANTGNWIGRIIVAVILGEAIWSLIVSLMNNLVVPWLGDVMGQSSGLPTSFTQRPYNYPDLFVSVVEFCIAGIVAAILNHFFQPSKAGRAKPGKSLGPAMPVAPIQGVPLAATTIVQPPLTQPAPLTQASSLPVARESAPKESPVTSSAPVNLASAAQVPLVAPSPKPVAVASAAPQVADSVAKPSPPAMRAEPPKLESTKPKKPKQVYYNIVGEPVSSDED
jgi:large-conductance mechanosensitive channel